VYYWGRVKKIYKSIKKSGGLIVSLVVVAAVLPIVLVATLSEDLRLKSMASQTPELRIWSEPGSVVARTGKEFVLKIYAEANPPEQVIPQVEFTFAQSGEIEFTPAAIAYNQPFSGKVVIGEIKVKVNKPGEWETDIPATSVFTRLPDLQVVTQGSKISAIK